MSRYDELVSLFIDGEPTQGELDELAEILRDHPDRARAFRDELALWEAYAQNVSPERSAEAFLAGLRTRLRAENDAPAFESRVKKQLQELRNPFLWSPLIALAAGVAIVFSLGVFLNPADVQTGLVPTAEANHFRVTGECVCGKCVLRSSERCRKAIRYVDEKGETRLLRVQRDPKLKRYNRCFCGGPTRAMIVGEVVTRDGEPLLLAESITLLDEKKQPDV